MSKAVTKKTFWHRTEKGIASVSCKKVKKVTSTTPMLYGVLVDMIYNHCKSEERNTPLRKITVTIKG